MAFTDPPQSAQGTLKAHVETLATRAVQVQGVSPATAAEAVEATLRALQPDLGRGGLSAAGRRRVWAYFHAVLRGLVVRGRRPADHEYRMALKIRSLVTYLEEAAFTGAALRDQVLALCGAEGLALAERAGMVPLPDLAA